MNKQNKTFNFVNVLWAYLNQPVFNKSQKTIFNPVKFHHVHCSTYLESCLTKNFTVEKQRAHLEICWHQNTVNQD